MESSWYMRNKLESEKETDQEIVLYTEVLRKNKMMSRPEGIEIYLVLEGNAMIFVNGIREPLSMGSFLMLTPYHYHRIEVENPLKVLVIRYPVSFNLRNALNKPAIEQYKKILWSALSVVNLNGAEFTKIKDIYTEIAENLNEDSQFSLSIAMHYVLILSAMYARLIAQTEFSAVSSQRDQFWNAVLELLKNFDKDLDLKTILKKHHLTEKELQNYMRKFLGFGIKDFVVYNKIFYATILLSFEELSIQRICAIAGFNSIATFNRHFNRFIGVSPEQYRESKLKSTRKGIQHGNDSTLKVLAYLVVNHDQNVSLSEIAETLYISEEHLNDLILKNLGKTIPELLIEIRLNVAKSLLCISDLKVNEIAVVAGFDSINTFNRNFKANYFMTAVEYREEACCKPKNEDFACK